MITTTITAYVNCPHCGQLHSERRIYTYTHNKWWHTTPAGHLTYCPRP